MIGKNLKYLILVRCEEIYWAQEQATIVLNFMEQELWQWKSRSKSKSCQSSQSWIQIYRPKL